MKYFVLLLLTVLLVADEIAGRSIKDSDDEERNVKRCVRGIEKWNFLKGRSTTPPTTTTTTLKPIRQNMIECKDDEEKQKDKVIKTKLI